MDKRFITIVFIFILLLVCDTIYIGFLNNSMYVKQFRRINGENIEFPLSYKRFIVPALLVYISLSIAIYYFFVHRVGSFWDMVFLGFLIYGTYNLTNYATIERWGILESIVDMIWGMFVMTFVAWLYTVVDKNYNIFN